MPDWLVALRDWLSSPDNNAFEQVVGTLVVLVAAYVLKKIGQRLITRYVEEPARQYRVSKMIGRTAALLAFLVILFIWVDETGELWSLVTIVGAGLAIAMREALLSIIGWINIVIRHPFSQGDRIQVNGIKGDVVDIRLMHSTLMEVANWVDAEQSTGRLLHFPNSWVFLHGIYNYTRGFSFIWNELSVTVTYRSDWQAAREIVLSLAEESAAVVEQQVKRQIKNMSREFLVHYSILSPFVYVKIAENGVKLSLRYLCEVRKRRGTEHALTMSILQAFKEHGGIELAYPMMGLAPMEPPQFGPLPSNNADGEAASERVRGRKKGRKE